MWQMSLFAFAVWLSRTRTFPAAGLLFRCCCRMQTKMSVSGAFGAISGKLTDKWKKWVLVNGIFVLLQLLQVVGREIRVIDNRLISRGLGSRR